MKIYYFIDEYTGPTAGTEGQLYLLIESMISRGHEVCLFVLRPTPYTRNAKDFPCRIVPLHIRNLASVSTLVRIVRLRAQMRREAPNAVHAFFNDSAVLVPFIGSKRRTHVFTSRRDMGFWYSKARLVALWIANFQCTAVICNAKAVAQEVQRREHISQDKTAVIYNAVSTSSSPHQPQIAPARVSASPHTFRVCLVANLRPIKRIEDLIVAASTVCASMNEPQVEFHLVGATLDPEYHSWLKSLCQTLGVQDKVKFVGQVSDPRQYIESFDLGVLTSSSEGLSNTLLEYMALGLPTICSNVGGNSEVIQHGVQGYVYECGDVDSLANYITMVASDQQVRMELSRKARERVNLFSCERMISAHEELYARGVDK